MVVCGVVVLSVASYRPIWISKELGGKIEAFIRKQYNINPSMGNLFIEVAKKAILFALSRPSEFKEFLDKTAH